MTRGFRALIVVCVMFAASSAGYADDAATIRIACAANFHGTVTELVRKFRQRHSDWSVEIISASSGQLYQQIRHGAPYHLFLSADDLYPARLYRDNKLPEPIVYAIGRLAWWHPGRDETLEELQQEHIAVAIANPATAPYGRAATQVIDRLGGGKAPAGWRIVTAGNISQAAQFVDSGNADAGFVALSLVADKTGRFLEIPAGWHRPLRQEAVLLRPDHAGAQAFFLFLGDPGARSVIRHAGYDLPRLREYALAR